MRIDRPPPGEELNEGPEAAARLAASAILLRDANGGPEVLLVQRNPAASFMGGAWVFPGGSVHDEDDGPAEAALRELDEEASIRIADPEALVPFSRWITPAEVSVRFDTWFFVSRAPDGVEGRADGAECVDLRWMAPSEALRAGERDEMLLVFPTIKHLEQLARLGSVTEALETARSRPVEPVLPRVVVRDGGAHVVLPGEPGYEDR